MLRTVACSSCGQQFTAVSESASGHARPRPNCEPVQESPQRVVSGAWQGAAPSNVQSAPASRVNCPHCGKPATLDDSDSEYRGALICPSCKQRFYLTFGAPADVGPSCQEHVILDPHAANTETAARVPKRNEPTRKSTNWLWPSVQTLQCAHKATRSAFWCAVVLAAVTALLSLLAASGVQAVLNAGISPWSLLDAALFVAIAIGLYRHSRFAAVAGLALYVAGTLVAWSETGIPPSYRLGMGIIFTLALIGGVRGTFAYHRMKQADTHDPAQDQSAVPLPSLAIDTEQGWGSPLDPEVLGDLAEIGYVHFKAGVRDKARWSERMVRDLGERVKPYLDEVWRRVQELHKDREGPIPARLRAKVGVPFMTPLRSVIVLVGILAIVAAGVYPPWQWKTLEGHLLTRPQEQGSYGWLWSPPQYGAAGLSRLFPAVLDLSRLLVEWFLIGAVTAVLAWVIPVLYKAACRAKEQ